MSSRRKDRKAVRKANRISAIDQEKPTRILRHYLSIVLALALIATEGFLLIESHNQYEYNQSIMLAQEISIDLGLIGSSLRLGDKASYARSLDDFREKLGRFESNYYVKEHANYIADSLKEYSNRLDTEATTIAQIIELNVAISLITHSADEGKSDNLDASKVYRLINSYHDLRDDLNKIDNPKLNKIKQSLTSYGDEIVPYLEKAAVCIGVCAEQTLNDKQVEITQVITRHKELIVETSRELSEDYNPNLLILELGAYSEP